jgi:hypothetical protein
MMEKSERIFNTYFKLIFVDDAMNQLEPTGIKKLEEANYSYGKAWRYQLEGIKGVYEVVQWDIQRSLLKINLPNLPVVEFSGPVFLLKYYPDPEEEVFEDFSVKEQILRLSAHFNYGKSPYPVLNSEEELDPTLFNIGIFYIVADDVLGIVRLGAYTQDRFISISQDGINLSNVLVVPPGGIDRNVPGWALTWNFLEKMAETYKRIMGKPYAAIGGVGKGKIWKCAQEKCFEEETESIRLKLFEIIFLASREERVLAVVDDQLESLRSNSSLSDLKTSFLWIDGKIKKDEDEEYTQLKDFLKK